MFFANYSYLSDGTKLSATDASGNGLCYLGSLVYNKQGNRLTLESAAVPGGRIITTNNGYDTRYFLTDHLGSVRAVVNNNGIVQEQSNYYAYGSRWNDGQMPDNRYLFNGKEAQSFVSLPYLDYGARQYDPLTGRWNGGDPLTEIDPSVSPFAFCNNNPMRYIDHFGLSPQDTVINADIPPVLITAKGNENEITGMSLWLSSISLGVTINHKYFHDTAKKGLYIGSYKGIKKQYSNKFYGNKQLSKAMVAAQKAKFAKKLKFLTKLKGVFTGLGIADAAVKAQAIYDKVSSGEDPSFEEVYSLVSAAASFAGAQGAIISLSADLQLLSTQNALNTLEATGDQELFIKTIQPGPRNF